MTVTLALAVFAGGFSLGAALLLVFAFASIYRGLVLPWHARVAGYAMLLGLGMTQYQHVLFLLNLSVTLVTRSYALVMFAQSLGFYSISISIEP